MKMDLTLIGCFRSGTNFTRTVLEKNYDCTIYYNTWGWKHGMMPTYNPSSKIEYQETKVLTVVKNPYSILLSWYNYLRTHNKNLKGNADSLSEFLRTPIYFYDEGNKGVAPQYYFCNPVQMWNSVVWNHLSFIKQMEGVVLRYEDLLENPEHEFGQVAEKFNLENTTDVLELPDKRVNNMWDNKDPNNRKYTTNKVFNKADFFLKNEFMSSFSDSDKDFVNSELNTNLVHELGYSEFIDCVK